MAGCCPAVDETGGMSAAWFLMSECFDELTLTFWQALHFDTR